MGFRDWETAPEKVWDENDDYYSVDTRRQDAMDLRRFDPSSLRDDLDGRKGHTRRWLRVNDPKYLKDEFIILNSYEGLFD